MSQVVTARSDFSGIDFTSTNFTEEILRTILSSRGISDFDAFVGTQPLNMEFLQTLQAAVGNVATALELIQSTINNNQSIFIHGDYDVDGVSSTAILWETLYYNFGYHNTFPFIPHRMEHGYGLSESSINDMLTQLKSKGLDPGLLITVDCGIVSKDTVAYAQSKGFTVIVTDHHTKPANDEDLPSALAILHSYDLCGAGIAWVLARSLDSSSLEQGVDLVALATLADLQNVTGYNRTLLKHGLSLLSHTMRPGLQALYQLAGIKGSVGPYEVGWQIGPRLNASGRLDHALNALRLLIAKGYQQALPLAQQIDELNKERQFMTQQAVEEACAYVEASWNKHSPIVVAHEDWHEGIIGIIASGLVEKYKVPAVVISHDKEKAKGSARSIDGINIVDLLRSSTKVFEGVGGHAMAAGFSLAYKNLETLLSDLAHVDISEGMQEEEQQPIMVDGYLHMDQLTWELYEAVQLLEPFGLGNARPTFYTPDALLSDYRVVGKQGDHLQLVLGNGIRGIAFGFGSESERLEQGQPVGVVYTIDKDDYRGAGHIQIKVKEIL